jgi:phenylacetate-CoA ligase
MIDLLIKHVTFPAYHRLRGDSLVANLRVLMETQYFSADRLNEIRIRKLRELLTFAFENSEFYRHRFTQAGVHPDQIRDFDDLRKLPMLTKAEIIENEGRLVASNFRPEELHRRATGGSTGQHVPFYRDNRCLGYKLAAEYRFNRWAGWDIGRSIAYVWPAMQDFSASVSWKGRIRNALLDRRFVLPSGKLDEGILASHVRRLQALSPFLIRAFPNPLDVLAKYIREHSRAVIRPKAILTTGEPLLPAQRSLFEEVFRCPVFNLYASRECGNHASECEVHSGMHIAVEGLHLEFVRDGRPVAQGQPGQILMTDFENYGMPFIRYQIQDMGALASAACSCGRSLPLMTFEAGRISDFVVSPGDGALVSGSSLCHYLIAEGPNVGQIQIIQDAPDHLTIRVRRSDEYRDDDAEKIANFGSIVDRIFGGRLKTSIEFVDLIPHERSGKYRFCINLVAQRSAQGVG